MMTTTGDLDLARERIEAAIREHDFCGLCGAPMVISVHDGGMWIECRSLADRRGIRRLLASGLHDRQRIDLPELALPRAA